MYRLPARMSPAPRQKLARPAGHAAGQSMQRQGRARAAAGVEESWPELDDPRPVEELKHEGALWRDQARAEALELPAPENKFLSSVQLDAERQAAARAVEHAKGMPTRPSFDDADAPILDTRNDHAVELEPSIQQTGRPS